MRTARAIALGALVGLSLATAFLVCGLVVVEWAHARHGLDYSDLTLAYFAQGLLVSAPIVGGWLAWVRRP